MSLSGRLIYNLWHRPLAAARNSMRHGGPFVQARNTRGERAMRIASAQLPPFPVRDPAKGPFTVNLLTGRKFVHQTAFCLHSLARVCPGPLHVEIYDDGSLDNESSALLRSFSPTLCIHDFAEIQTRLDEFLPTARYPVLRERWLNYPHIRKLIDVHLGRTGWRLVLDSDLLFWREPLFLLDWANATDRPLHATDCRENYGYTRPLLEKIAGCPLPPLVNVGLCGLHSNAIDWDFLEHDSATLIEAENTSYYLEQGLVALLVARHGNAAIAPVRDYLTMPSSEEIARPTAVMHHYVDLARGPYYRTAWRAFV